MLGSLAGAVPLLPSPARRGRFRVLASRGVPGVLVEIGFISNRRDEALLRRPSYRSVVARVVLGGLDRFLSP